MKKGLYGFIWVSLWLTAVSNDQQAYELCAQDPCSFIAIIWPIAQGNDALIYTIFKRYGVPIYKKKYYFTKPTAYMVLKYAHPHIPAPMPHCSSMKEHLKWYFPKNVYALPARIFLVRFKDTATATACKMAVRKLYPDLQYRSIHINDYHHEAVKLAQFFFLGINTLDT